MEARSRVTRLIAQEPSTGLLKWNCLLGSSWVGTMMMSTTAHRRLLHDQISKLSGASIDLAMRRGTRRALASSSTPSERFLKILDGTVALVEDKVGQVVPMRCRPRRVRPPQSGFVGFRSHRRDHGGGALVPALRVSNRDLEELLADRGIEVDP